MECNAFSKANGNDSNTKPDVSEWVHARFNCFLRSTVYLFVRLLFFFSLPFKDFLVSCSQSSNAGWGEGGWRVEAGIGVADAQAYVRIYIIHIAKESEAPVRNGRRLRPGQSCITLAGGVGLVLLLHAAAGRISSRHELPQPERPASAARYATWRARYVYLRAPARLWLALRNWSYTRGLRVWMKIKDWSRNSSCIH